MLHHESGKAHHMLHLEMTELQKVNQIKWKNESIHILTKLIEELKRFNLPIMPLIKDDQVFNKEFYPKDLAIIEKIQKDLEEFKITYYRIELKLDTNMIQLLGVRYNRPLACQLLIENIEEILQKTKIYWQGDNYQKLFVKYRNIFNKISLLSRLHEDAIYSLSQLVSAPSHNDTQFENDLELLHKVIQENNLYDSNGEIKKVVEDLKGLLRGFLPSSEKEQDLVLSQQESHSIQKKIHDIVCKLRKSLQQIVFNEKSYTDLFKSLIFLAKLSPINDTSCISLSEIAHSDKIHASTGHQFSITELIDFHNERHYLETDIKHNGRKKLTNINANVPFTNADTIYIIAAAQRLGLQINPVSIPQSILLKFIKMNIFWASLILETPLLADLTFTDQDEKLTENIGKLSIEHCRLVAKYIQKTHADKTSTLYFFIKCGFIELVKEWIDHYLLVVLQQKLTSASHFFQPILEFAINLGDVECVKVLQQSGADLNARGLEGKSALDRAAERGDEEMVAFLLENGCKIEMNDTVFTPLHYAAQKGHLHIIKRFMPSLFDHLTPTHKNLLLHAAVKGGCLDLVETLLNQCVDVNSYSDNKTPLFVAVEYNQLRIAKLLIEKGADHRRCCDKKNLLPLHVAARNNNDDMILLLIRSEKSLGESAKEVLNAHYVSICSADKPHPFLSTASNFYSILEELNHNIPDYSRLSYISLLKEGLMNAPEIIYILVEVLLNENKSISEPVILSIMNYLYDAAMDLSTKNAYERIHEIISSSPYAKHDQMKFNNVHYKEKNEPITIDQEKIEQTNIAEQFNLIKNQISKLIEEYTKVNGPSLHYSWQRIQKDPSRTLQVLLDQLEQSQKSKPLIQQIKTLYLEYKKLQSALKVNQQSTDIPINKEDYLRELNREDLSKPEQRLRKLNNHTLFKAAKDEWKRNKKRYDMYWLEFEYGREAADHIHRNAYGYDYKDWDYKIDLHEVSTQLSSFWGRGSR